MKCAMPGIGTDPFGSVHVEIVPQRPAFLQLHHRRPVVRDRPCSAVNAVLVATIFRSIYRTAASFFAPVPDVKHHKYAYIEQRT
jgi:hypothetical protein